MSAHLNLLPPQLTERRMLRAALRRWLAVWVSAALVAGLVTWAERSHCSVAAQRAEMLKSRYAPIERLEWDIRRMRRRLLHIQAKQPTTLTQVQQHSVISALALVSQAASDCSGNISVQMFSFQEQFPQQDAGQRAELAPRVSLTVKGEAEDNLAIAQMAATLRESGLFGHVDVQVTADQASARRQYQIACVLDERVHS